MAPLMLLNEDDLEAVARAYHGQIEFGSDKRTALNLATIVYQQRHPYAVAENTRLIVEESLVLHQVH
mgnify:CR=1 FL=1|jgi:hypothetical protein